MNLARDEDEIEQAAVDALAAAGDRPLPIAATSLSRDAVLSRHQVLLFFGGLLIAAGILTAILFALQQRPETRGDMLVFTLFFAVAISWAFYFVVQRRLREPRAYRDPGITIEVRDDGVLLAAPAASHKLDWGEIKARITTVTHQDCIYFEGLALESPFGTQKLNDAWYRNGRIAAAAIVREMEAARLAREREKVGRIV